MTDFFNLMQNTTTTENGAVAFNSTLNACLDAFGSLGAMMRSNEKNIIDIFEKAYNENSVLALKMLFYMRDVRGGQGQRRVFRVILKWLAENYPLTVIKNFDNILFYGRGDDYLCLLDTDIAKDVCIYIAETLAIDCYKMCKQEDVSLLAKWLPSENASSTETKRYAAIIRNNLKWTPKQYRIILSKLRKYIDVVERKMSTNQWANINYNTVPSKASLRYVNSFHKHDEIRYNQYVADLANGKANINAGALFPVDIVHSVLSTVRCTTSLVLDAINNASWKALPNYFGDSEETGLCVVDTSASMSGIPYEVAVSLGIYCADKCRGPFAGKFITFSEKPTLETLKGNNITENVRGLKCINAGNTDFEAVFDLILNTGKTYNVADSDMPKKLYIISDMQFDAARGTHSIYSNYHTKKPFMQQMKEKYREAGYTMPTLIYWNVRQSNCGMFHTTFEGENCAVVSGYSPSLFKAIIEGTEYETSVDEFGKQIVSAKVDPMTIMLNTLNNERYDRVVVD